jgi:hypothetical protein
MKGRNRAQVDVNLNMITTSDGDRSSLVSFGSIGVVGDRVGNVKRSVHEGRRISIAGSRGRRMNRVPGPGIYEQEVGAAVKRCYLIGALIIRGRRAEWPDVADPD